MTKLFLPALIVIATVTLPALAQEYITSSSPFENDLKFRQRVVEKFNSDPDVLVFKSNMDGKTWRAGAVKCTGQDGKPIVLEPYGPDKYLALGIEFSNSEVIQKDFYRKKPGLIRISYLQYDWFNVNVVNVDEDSVSIKGSFKLDDMRSITPIGMEELKIMKDPNHINLELPLIQSEIQYNYWNFKGAETLTLKGIANPLSQNKLCKSGELVSVRFYHEK